MPNYANRIRRCVLGGDLPRYDRYSTTLRGHRPRGRISATPSAKPTQRDSVGEADSARLFVRLVLAAVRAELLDLETIGIVTTVLLGDVVAVLAHLAGQGDLWPDVS